MIQCSKTSEEVFDSSNVQEVNNDLLSEIANDTCVNMELVLPNNGEGTAFSKITKLWMKHHRNCE